MIFNLEGEEIAYSDTTNLLEYLSLNSIDPGEYIVEVYGYDGSISDYDILYSIIPSGTLIDGIDIDAPWYQKNIVNLGSLLENLEYSEQSLVASAFYGFTLEDNTNRGIWEIILEATPWDSDLDLYLYRAR